ncbi:unnamed protein product, partial [Rotaria sp. Silwood2]
NDASIEVRPAKSHSYEQQRLQMQQQYQYEEYVLLHSHHHNPLVSSVSVPTMTHQSIIALHSNRNSYYTHISNNNNYPGQ